MTKDVVWIFVILVLACGGLTHLAAFVFGMFWAGFWQGFVDGLADSGSA